MTNDNATTFALCFVRWVNVVVGGMNVSVFLFTYLLIQNMNKKEFIYVHSFLFNPSILRYSGKETTFFGAFQIKAKISPKILHDFFSSHLGKWNKQRKENSKRLIKDLDYRNNLILEFQGSLRSLIWASKFLVK